MLWWKLLIASGAISIGFAQTYDLTTIAGGGVPDNISVANLAVNEFGVGRHMIADAKGGLYFSVVSTTGFLANRPVLLRLDSSGVITAIAGNGTISYSGDGGPARQAGFVDFSQFDVDSAGVIYVNGGGRIRKISGGIVTTISGNGI